LIIIYSDSMEKIEAVSQTKPLIYRLETLLWSVAFLTPLLVAGPQWLVGTMVNAYLFVGAVKLDKKNLLPLIFLPSIGALGHGVLFGPLTLFLIYFMPFIWLGNWVLVTIFSKLRKKTNQTVGLFVGTGVKALVLFLAANVYVGFKIVPSIFLTAMGWVQLGTALLGGILALSVLRFGLGYERS